MAPVFRLANVDQSLTVDLLSGPLKLASPWQTRTPEYDYSYHRGKSGLQTVFGQSNYVTEEFDIIGEDTNNANLIAAIHSIEAMLVKASLFIDDVLKGESIWLEAYADGEQPKRALIVSGSLRYYAKVDGVSALLRYGAVVADFSITRLPVWENISVVSQSFSALSCWGGKTSAISNTGTAEARVSQLQLRGDNSGDTRIRFWAGLRPTYYGVSGFIPVWEMEAGTPDNSSAVASESGASPSGSSSNNKIRTNFGGGGTSLLRRAWLAASGVTGISPNYAHMVGRYLVLLRCKLSAGASQVGVQLRAGVLPASGVSVNGFALPANSEAYITHTTWQLIELGEVVIPPAGYRTSVQAAGAIQNFTMEVWAERISGSADLDIDALCLIPSEHFAFVDGTSSAFVLSPFDDQPTIFITDEDNAPQCLYYKNGVPNQAIAFTMRDLVLPVEGGVLVLAGETPSGHQLDKTALVALQTFPRWKSYRNA